jgi:hypothetical protein
MHAEIKAVLNDLNRAYPAPNTVTLQSAEMVLNYIEDINLERTNKFELTPAESLYLLWTVENWEFHIECLSNGCILYTFRKGGYRKCYGSISINEFIPLLENYLLTILV